MNVEKIDGNFLTKVKTNKMEVKKSADVTLENEGFVRKFNY